ncbi:MAG TPA: cation diffusion facilitator family transporter [Nevskiaceae bacterium]|nr:cation diffusion facilitator family transporter [Nevskiaceae bacterium]
MDRSALTRYAWLSIAAAIATIGLKTLAWQLTGSMGLLSDALESLVNLLSAIVAMIVLRIAAQPADAEHPYGHDKAEYFSSVLEGIAILLAAVSIAWAAVPRLLHPQPVMEAPLGLAVNFVATLVNFGTSRVLLSAGRRHDSVTLQADAHHLMTDVWTSVGVLAAVVLVVLTGWLVLDPLIALVVAAQIVWTGLRLVVTSVEGLMDSALPPPEQDALQEVLNRYREQHGIAWHALRTRAAGSRRFVTVHVLVPGGWSVQRGHDLVEQMEAEMARRLKRLTVVTHLEPLEDEVSWRDQELERPEETHEHH